MILLVSLLLMLASGVPMLAREADAVVLSHEESFTMQTPSSGTYRVRATVLVCNEDGLEQATPVIYTDSFRSITSFGGEVESAGRKTKFGRKDLQTVSISSGLADDSYISAYEPSGRYPFTVRYEYTVAYKNGIISFPVFSPVEAENVLLKQASYRLDLPAGTRIVSWCGRVDEHPRQDAKGRSVYEWSVKDVEGITDEELMPPLRELLPTVYAAPVNFSYAQTSGSQADWKQYGLWLYGLQQGSGTLSDEAVAYLKEQTRDCGTTLERLRVLYSILRRKTRYVAIQLGIGKLKPIAAAEVERSGFGDCKALSNYLQAMLAAVGVPSDYYIIHTDRKDLLPGFTSAGQMNHAMLAVPLPETGDTVFVECTNPRIPLGYRPESVAGHEIVLIKPDGGEHVRIGDYPDSLSRREQRTEVTLSSDGSASLRLRRHLLLDFTESYLDWDDYKQDTRERMLTSGLKLHPEELHIDAVTNNFDRYEGRWQEFRPEMSIDYSFRARHYAHGDGVRLFVPMNPVSKGLTFQKGERQNEMLLPVGYTSADTVVVRIPVGYKVESLPENTVLETPWADFRSEAREDGGCVVVVQSIRFKPFRAPASRYPEFRDFARKVNRCYDATFVLVKPTA